MSDLPSWPPAGHKRYKAHSRKPGDNPFLGSGLKEYTQTVDIDRDTPFEQVERWAREAAEQGGFEFLRLEEVVS
jgi:hypothetical protein